jgi:hypothetical protein
MVPWSQRAIHARGYGSTEAWIGSPYNPLELNQFKPSNEIIIEFLDISKSDSISSLAQLVGTRVIVRRRSLLTSNVVGG